MDTAALIRRLFFLALCAWSLGASALTPYDVNSQVKQEYRYCGRGNGVSGQNLERCSTRQNGWIDGAREVRRYGDLIVAIWRYGCPDNAFCGDYPTDVLMGYEGGELVDGVHTCPENSTGVNGDACKCNGGYQAEPSRGACVPNPCNSQRGSSPAYPVALERLSNDLTPAKLVQGGCEVSFTPTSCRQTTISGNTSWWCDGQATYTGASVGGTFAREDGTWYDTSTLARSGTDSTPPAGKCPGTVNGTQVWVPCGSTNTPASSSGTTSTTTPNADGTSTKTDVTKTTSCDSSGQCSTSTTTTTTNIGTNGQPTGTPTTTTTAAQADRQSFCQENPTSPICKSSSWGGSCEGGFTCDGDAVSCAIARETYTRNCQLFQSTPLSERGLGYANGELRPAGHPANTPDTVNVSLASMLDDRPLFGGASCPSDVVVPVGLGHTATIGFSSMCGSLNVLGIALHGFALLAAAFIVFRRT